MKNKNVLKSRDLHNPGIDVKEHQLCFFLIKKESKETIFEFENILKFLHFFKDNPHMVNDTLVLVVDFDIHIGVEWEPCSFIQRCCDIGEGASFSTKPNFISI